MARDVQMGTLPKEMPEIECVLYDVANGGNNTSVCGIGEPKQLVEDEPAARRLCSLGALREMDLGKGRIAIEQIEPVEHIVRERLVDGARSAQGVVDRLPHLERRHLADGGVHRNDPARD